jgi:hypothetical protein
MPISSLRDNAHENTRADKAHAEPGVARNELPVDVPFAQDREEESE